MISMAQVILGEEEKAAVLDVMDSGQLAQGSVVKEFEEEVAKAFGVEHAVATSNGTAALHTALVANGIGVGDEVITTPFSFIATANAIKMAGAKPIFIDVEEETANINPKLIKDAITSNTKAIMLVHLYGRPSNMDEISKISREYDLKVIEDACQAHGAEYKRKKVGSFGTGCFSLYATKNIITGEGGLLTTNDAAVAKLARKFIHHGSSERYHHDMLGYNYRMTNLMAAIGLEQLKKLAYFNKRRRKNAQYLSDRLQSLKGIIVPEVSEGHVFHQYTIKITTACDKSRNEIRCQLLKHEIASEVFYPIPIHKQKSYLECCNQDLPIAEKLSQEVLSLPVYPTLTENDLDKIVRSLCEICNSSKR